MTPKHITDRDSGTLTYDFDTADTCWQDHRLQEMRVELWSKRAHSLSEIVSRKLVEENVDLESCHEQALAEDALHALNNARRESAWNLWQYNQLVGFGDASKA
jgi:hypothetical protein